MRQVRLNRLSLRIFLATWLICSLLMGGLVSILLWQHERQHWQELHQQRAEMQGLMLIERHESGEPLRRGNQGRGRLMPFTLHNLQTGERIGELRFNTDDVLSQQLDIRSASGQIYRLAYPSRRPPEYLPRLLRFFVSLQMFIVLLSAALVAGLVSLWVTRPVLQLKAFAQALRHEDNLSQRTQDHISQRQDELGELARALDQMAQHLDDTLSAREELLRDISHQLRTPLARLRLATGLLEQQGHPSCLPLAQQINDNTDQLDRLIDQLLERSRLHKTPLTSDHPVALLPLIEQLRQPLEALYPGRHWQLHWHTPIQTSDIHPFLLQSLLGNVIGNAYKYTPLGGQIVLQIWQDDQCLKVQLTDTGPGIPADKRLTVLQPFVRLNQNTPGHGLGLSLVASIVERLGGSLSLGSHTPCGLNLELNLPQPEHF